MTLNPQNRVFSDFLQFLAATLILNVRLQQLYLGNSKRYDLGHY